MINEGANPPGRSSGYVDINCHILPGLDDGAADLRTSIGMLKIAYEEGIRTIIATPDYRRQYKETDMDKLKAVFERVKNEAAKISPDLRLYFGREIFYDNDAHEKIVSGEISSLAKSRYVMLEFPVDIDYETIAEAIRDISMDGYIPIVSHVETYSCLGEDEDMVEDLIKLGAYIQVDSGSVMGENGHDIRNFARKLVKNEMVHFIATDAHDCDDKAPLMKECAEYIERKCGFDYMNEVLYINPMAIIENDDVEII